MNVGFALLLIFSSAAFVSGVTGNEKMTPKGVIVQIMENKEEDSSVYYDIIFTSTSQKCRPVESSGTPPTEKWDPEVFTTIRVEKRKADDYILILADVKLKLGSNTYEMSGFALDAEAHCEEETPECLTPLFSSLRYRNTSPNKLDVGVLTTRGSKCGVYPFVVGDDNDGNVKITEASYRELDCAEWKIQFTASSSTYTDDVQSRDEKDIN